MLQKRRLNLKRLIAFACGRCHANRYDNWTQLGYVPRTKENSKQQVLSLDANRALKRNLVFDQNKLADYMGKLPPDLSIISKSKNVNTS